MKTAKILKKSVLNPGNNWITLLNSANLSKKNAVTPVNFHLYHYAANNPVRYTDPDGRLTFDEETKTIIADLNDKEDMMLAGHVFMEYQYDGYVCKAVDSKTNQSVTFTRARELYAFMEGTYEQYLENDKFNSDEFFLDLLNLVTATETIGTVRSSLNTALTTVSVVIDGYKAFVCLWNNDIPGAINSTIDTMIDSIGYIPFYGTLISVELKYSKRGIIFAANEMARAQIELEHYAVRRWYEILPYIIPRF